MRQSLDPALLLMTRSPKVIRLADAEKRAGTRAVSRLPEGSEKARSEAELVQALRAGNPWAERALVGDHSPHVERILVRILGGHPDLDDLTQEVFVRAFERLGDLREPPALRPWLTAIAVFVAREAIRKTRRRRWLIFSSVEAAQEIEIPAASVEARAALRAFYEVVSSLDADKRIAFTLRFVEGMELTEVAEACDVSLATIKRRIKSAEIEFQARAGARAELTDWLEAGTRWR